MLRLVKYNQKEFAIKNEIDIKIETSVRKIIDDVRQFGDKAIFNYAKKFDGFDGESIKVTNEEIENALNSVDKNIFRILKRAKYRLKNFIRDR
jgi:histidinol dehydrogenase